MLRDAIQVGDELVRAGYYSVETMSKTLELVRRGKLDAVDKYLMSVVRLRQEQRNRK